MPPFYRFAEICLYSLLNFLPFLVLAIYPFRKHLRFPVGIVCALTCILTVAQFSLGIWAAFFSGGKANIISAVSTLLYAVFYFLAVRMPLGKTLFTLMMLSNTANLIVIVSKCIEGRLFPALALQSYAGRSHLSCSAWKRSSGCRCSSISKRSIPLRWKRSRPARNGAISG